MNKNLKISGKITNAGSEYMFILKDFVLDIKLLKCNDKNIECEKVIKLLRIRIVEFICSQNILKMKTGL